jgi:hypothetical protein
MTLNEILETLEESQRAVIRYQADITSPMSDTISAQATQAKLQTLENKIRQTIKRILTEPLDDDI